MKYEQKRLTDYGLIVYNIEKYLGKGWEERLRKEIEHFKQFDKLVERSLKVSEKTLNRRIGPCSYHPPRKKHENPYVEEQLREMEDFDRRIEESLKVSEESLNRRMDI